MVSRLCWGKQGRIQDFHLGGGGGAKIMCPHAHYERKTELTFGRGPRARLWALETLGLFLCSLSLILGILIIKKFDQNKHPLDPPLTKRYTEEE